MVKKDMHERKVASAMSLTIPSDLEIDQDRLADVAAKIDADMVADFDANIHDPNYRLKLMSMYRVNEAIDHPMDITEIADAIDEVRKAVVSKAAIAGEFDEELMYKLTIFLTTRKSIENGMSDEQIINSLNQMISVVVNGGTFADVQ